MSTNWSKDCLGRRYLIGEFQQFIKSGRTAGIDPELAKKIETETSKERDLRQTPSSSGLQKGAFP